LFSRGKNKKKKYAHKRHSREKTMLRVAPKLKFMVKLAVIAKGLSRDRMAEKSWIKFRHFFPWNF